MENEIHQHTKKSPWKRINPVLIIILLLVILIFAITIRYGIFGFLTEGDTSEPMSADGRFSSTVVIPKDWWMEPNGTFYLYVKNNAKYPIRIMPENTSVTIVYNGNGRCTLNYDRWLDELPPNGIQNINFTSCPIEKQKREYSYYKANITIYYYNKLSGELNITEGQLWGPSYQWLSTV